MIRIGLMQSLLVGISLIIATLIGEVVVRLMAPQELGIWIYTRDGMTSHFPNIRQYSYKFGHEIVTNSVGMRDREHAVGKQDGVFRILVLGDSFMEANQVKFDDSFVSVLERQLNERAGLHIEVISASVSGWGTDDELTYFMREGAKYKPDLVLVAMTIHNDVSDNLEEEYHVLRDGKLDEKPLSLVPWPSYTVLKVKEWLNAHSHLYKLCYQASQMRGVSAQGKILESHVGGLLRKHPDDRIRMGWEITEHLFGKLIQRAADINAKVVVVLLPLSVQIYSETLGEFAKLNGLPEEEINLMRPQQAMREMGRKVGFPVIDLMPVFTGVRNRCTCDLFVKDDGHWNEKGHKIAADFVSGQLVDLSVLQKVK